MASASGYNHHRFARALLKKSRKWEASLTIELLPTHWRFAHSPVPFQYNGIMTPFLLALRSQVVPASLIPFLYDIKPPISFYDGCLVVEIHDLRKTPEVNSRVVMRPAAETLAQTIDVMLDKRGWNKGDGTLSLELESRIIAATSPPLFLGTSILPARNAAVAIQLTTPAHPNVSATGSYRAPKSGASTSDEKSQEEIIRKMMHIGDSRSAQGVGGFQPKWPILDVKARMEERARQAVIAGEQAQREQIQQQQMQQQQQQQQQQNAIANGGPGPGAGPGGADVKPKKAKKKRPAVEENAAKGNDAGGSKPKKKKVDGEKKKNAGGGGAKKKAAAAAAAAASAASTSGTAPAA